jgi:hypothetical protein
MAAPAPTALLLGWPPALRPPLVGAGVAQGANRVREVPALLGRGSRAVPPVSRAPGRATADAAPGVAAGRAAPCASPGPCCWLNPGTGPAAGPAASPLGPAGATPSKGQLCQVQHQGRRASLDAAPGSQTQLHGLHIAICLCMCSTYDICWSCHCPLSLLTQ